MLAAVEGNFLVVIVRWCVGGKRIRRRTSAAFTQVRKPISGIRSSLFHLRCESSLLHYHRTVKGSNDEAKNPFIVLAFEDWH